MIDDELAKRFGWWWGNNPAQAAKALRRAFPEKSSEEAIRKYVWPELWRAAFNYELASRANSQRKYLLAKRFDRLTQKQIGELVRLWPRKPRPLQPIFFPPDTEDFRDVRRWGCGYRGWTAPQKLMLNLAGCSDRAICQAFRKHVAAEREHLGIAAPARNKGRANKSSKRGLSFHRIEALDVWSLPRKGVAAIRAALKKKNSKDYDAGQMRSARREARQLLREWQERR